MSPSNASPRIVRHPFAHLMADARLDFYTENGNEIRMEVQGLEILEADVFQRDGVILERGRGRYIPLKLTFTGVHHLQRPDFFTALDQYPPTDFARTIGTMHAWIMPGMDDIFHLFGMRNRPDANMTFFAGGVAHEQGEAGEPFPFERDWSPSPPMPGGEVPQPYELHDRFGGDPVAIRLNGQIVTDKLFVGGIENQPETRPEIDAVLNLGERPSAWVKGGKFHPNDRTVEKGEGAKGMSAEEIRAEAEWVIERLRRNESVLIHCVAGMNRSTTVCCAVLMQLEGLTAEQALERVYEHHPWAKPDAHHWLMLKWLEKNR
ncbi:MAG: dual specificity protein phosphatase [Chloroflexota bacterium]